MKFAVLLLLTLVTSVYGEVHPIQNIVALLRETPAYGSGSLYVATPVLLHEQTITKKLFGIGRTNVNMNTFVKISLKPNKRIDFGFGENYITMKPDAALDLRIDGIKIGIKDVAYTVGPNGVGDFKIKTSTPLGLFNSIANRKVQAALKQIFEPRLKKAFAELKRIRQVQTTDQAQSSLNSIIDILQGPPSPGDQPMPVVNASVDLAFVPEQKKSVRIAENLWAYTKAGDQITMGVDLTVKSGKTNITALRMHSDAGVRVQPKTKIPELVSVNISDITLDASGFKMNYDIGAEEMIGAVAILLGQIQSMGRGPTNCPDPVRLKFLRSQIDRRVLAQLGVVIRAQRSALLDAGIQPQLLAAFSK